MNQPPPSVPKKTTVTEVKEEEKEDLDNILDNDEFAKQLAAGMENLMGQFGQEDDMKEAFEKVWASFDNNNTPDKTREAATSSSKTPQSFQEAIGKTMNKLKDSSKEIDVSVCICVCMFHLIHISYIISRLLQRTRRMRLWLN